MILTMWIIPTNTSRTCLSSRLRVVFLSAVSALLSLNAVQPLKSILCSVIQMRLFLPSDITLTPTLAAVFFIAVVHAVQHVVAAPAPRDAVGPIQTQELVFSALLHTADLLAKTQAFSSTQRRHKGSSTAEPWRFMSPQPREHKRC